MRIIALVLLAAALSGPLPAEDLLTGYHRQDIRHAGPGEWRLPEEPIWVYAYPTLRLVYRASGLAPSDTPVLILRPGSVGPVTPGAANPENPFVAGMPVPAVTARDLIADGALHTLEVDLRGRMRTPQVDQLRFTLPAGARLEIDHLEFRAAPDLLPCQAGGPALPAHAARLETSGPLKCASFPATSLRGRQALRIEGNGRQGRTLYLALFPHLPYVTRFAAGQPPDKVRIKETSETADVLVRLRYTDGFEEEQFPFSLDERRPVLLNRKPALYALSLDPRRRLASAELLDRAAHVQLVLFAAGISPQPNPGSEPESLSPTPDARKAPAPPDLSASPWYRIAAAAGRQPPPGAIQADLRQTTTSGGRLLSLALRNVSREPQEFTLAFPAVTIRPAQAADQVYYVFPRQGAVISRMERTLEAPYNAAFPLQFVDVFAPAANSGACVIVHDTAGRTKKFRLRKHGPAVDVEAEYTVRLAPGESFRPPDAQIASHGGDWHAGLAAYRQWVASWYKPAGPRPAWLRSTFWARREYPIGGAGVLYDAKRGRYTYPELLRDGQAFGGIDFIDISGWAMSETVGRVGDYPIELGGPEDLRRNIAQGLQAGVPTGLYFEGYLIDKHSAVGRAHGAEWQLIDANGQGAWWKGGDPRELFVCPYVPAWQQFLSNRVAEVARQTGAGGVYLDEFGFGRMRCYSPSHGHPVGVETLPGEIQMAKAVRQALEKAGMRDTMLYIEETPPDAAAPYYDAAFCYNFPYADPLLSPVRLNLSRFVFPDIRLWDMLSIGIDARVLPSEDFRLSLWHGNGLWLKGHADTWYGDDLLRFIRRSRALLKQHEAAFNGLAEPLVESPHPAVLINRFTADHETVYTLFNASYRTARFVFQGRARTLAPRDVDVIPAPRN